MLTAHFVKRAMPWYWMAAVGCLTVLAVPPAAAVNLAGTHWEHVAKRHGLDPVVLYAVAIQESQKPRGHGLASPWPWVTRSPEGARFYPSRADAATDLRRLVSRYKPVQIDVGLLQVNLGWHGQKVADPTDLLDARTNMEIAADILSAALHSAPGDPELGLGRYNTYTERLAREYGRKVLAVIDVLRQWGRG